MVVRIVVVADIRPVKAYTSELLTLVWSSTELDDTYSIAWGDVDGDSDLDLAVGNANHPNRLYLNHNGTLSSSAVWSSVENDDAISITWGDVDGDGDLDLAVGSIEHTRLYRNENGILTTSAVWTSEDTGSTSIAWGDYDLDGDLDLAAGKYSSPNGIYRNDSGLLTSIPVWNSEEMDNTASIAWGDYDGDGDLDLAVGNTGYPSGQPNRLYRNDGGVLTSSAVWSTDETDATNSVAWGDYDNDGDLDLSAGNGGYSPIGGQPNRLYRNDGGSLITTAVWSSNESDNT